MAVVGTVISTILCWILYLIAGVLSLIANLLTGILFWAASIPHFTTMEQIIKAWVVIRDLSNMFFIVILLVIAFATVLKGTKAEVFEKYSYQKLLGRFVMMAILINFSKSICGIFIDVSQVFMFTFLNALNEVQANGMLAAFGLHKLMASQDGELSAGTVLEFKGVSILFSLIMVVILLMVFIIVILVYTVLLAGRACMLWLLIVISPLAYVASILPVDVINKFAKQWWDKFLNYVILGPMIAFFMWLSLFIATYKGGSISGDMKGAVGLPANTGSGLVGAANPDIIVNLIMATMLMLGGLQITTSMANEFSSITGKIQSGGFAFMKGAAKFAGRRLDDVQNGIRTRTGGLIKRLGGGVENLGRKVGVGGTGVMGTLGNGLSRSLAMAGKVTQGLGSTVGHSMSLRPSEIANAYKDITSRWEGKSMDERRKGLRTGMAGLMAPTLWGGKKGKEMAEERAKRENTNAADMEQVAEAMEGLDGSQEGNEDAAAVIDQVMKNLESRMKDPDASRDERARMGDTLNSLGVMHRNLSGEEGGTDEARAAKARSLFNHEDEVAKRGTYAKQGQKFSQIGRDRAALGTKLAWYADDIDFENEFNQKRIAEEAKVLDEKTNGESALVIPELASARASGNKAKIIACMRSLQNSQDYNELHGNADLMHLLETEVRKLGKSQGFADDSDEMEQLVNNSMENYTSAPCLSLLKKALLDEAFDGNEGLMSKEGQRLAGINMGKGGGGEYGDWHVDGKTGLPVYNKPQVMMDHNGNMRLQSAAMTNAALDGKTKNISARERARITHPGLWATRGKDGKPGGMAASAPTAIANLETDFFNRINELRPDNIDQMADDAVLRDSVGFLQAAEQTSHPRHKQAQAMMTNGRMSRKKGDIRKGKANYVIMAALKHGLMSGQEPSKFFDKVRKHTDDIIDVDALANAVALEGKAQKDAIKAIIDGINSPGGGGGGGGGGANPPTVLLDHRGRPIRP